jgi:hypothetical protein
VNLLIFVSNRDGDDRMLFESFETSAVSEDVLAAEGPLEWDFPGSAVSIPTSIFADASFQEELATFLSQASKESIKQFAAMTNKAGAFITESRDTVNPSLITSMLMTILEANGARSFPPILRKRIRDDVCWSDGARKPWRRSPFWLVLRIGIQRQLSALHGGEVGRVLYKFLMCQILSDLLEESLKVFPNLDIELVSHLNTKLCRRLAKLEIDKERALPKFQVVYDHMFTILGPIFDKITINAVGYIEGSWTQFKTANQRPVPTLPRRSDPRHFHLVCMLFQLTTLSFFYLLRYQVIMPEYFLDNYMHLAPSELNSILTFQTLPNSGRYIQQVLNSSRHPIHPATVSNSHPNFNVSSAVNKEGQVYALHYVLLSERETDIEQSQRK